MWLIYVWLLLVKVLKSEVEYESTCLSQPSELTLTQHGNSKIHKGTLSLVAESFDIYSLNDAEEGGRAWTFTSRVFNGQIPGPTIRMKRGHQYRITYKNELEANDLSEDKMHNTLHDLNTTNLHVHGLHVSGEAPGDDTFIKIEPGGQYEYRYNLPCDHAGGLFWYHPHHHGSSLTQVGGGATGMIVVEDDAEMEGLPEWYTSMTEYLLMIQHYNLQTIDGERRPNNQNRQFHIATDWLFKFTTMGGDPNFYLLNGEYMPTICINSNEWTRLRMIFNRINGPPETRFFIYNALTGGVSNACTMKVLSRDGVLVHGTDNTVPRDISYWWIPIGGRFDIALFCPGDELNSEDEYKVYTLRAAAGGQNTIAIPIAIIHVYGNRTSVPFSLTTFHPIRPSYLEDLRNIDSNEVENVKLAISTQGLSPTVWDPSLTLGLPTIVPYINSDTFFKHFILHQVYEIELCTRSDGHPFHMHVNQFQVVGGGRLFYIDGQIAAIGDFLDVVFVPGNGPQPPPGAPGFNIPRGTCQNQFTGPNRATNTTIRFKPHNYGGKLTVHCHMFIHSDRGVMNLGLIHGGCDNNLHDNYIFGDEIDVDDSEEYDDIVQVEEDGDLICSHVTEDCNDNNNNGQTQ